MPPDAASSVPERSSRLATVTTPAAEMENPVERSVKKSLPKVSCVVEALLKTAVEEAKSEKGAPRSQSGVEVELVFWPKFVVAVHSKVPLPVSSVPQENTPLVLAFTSQLAEFNADTVRFVVEAVVNVLMVVEA